MASRVLRRGSSSITTTPKSADSATPLRAAPEVSAPCTKSSSWMVGTSYLALGRVRGQLGVARAGLEGRRVDLTGVHRGDRAGCVVGRHQGEVDRVLLRSQH